MGKLSASILSADHAFLAGQVKLIDPYADVIHVDVMDAHFVPPLTVGAVVVASLRPHTERVLHGHLIAQAPEALFEDLAAAGMNMVSFHVEAVEDPSPVIGKARGVGMGVGVSLNVRTSVEAVFPYLDELDDVVLMGRPPASAGTRLDPDVFRRIEAVRSEVERRGLAVEVEAEGEVTLGTAARFVDAGATVLVAGSAIFGAPDAQAAARELKAIAEGGA